MPNIKPKVTALVLAAGKGTRFGGDKLLHAIPYTNQDGTISTSAIGLISALNVKPHVDDVLCVVRPHDHDLINLYKEHGLSIVTNDEYEVGLSTSIQKGIESIKPNHHIMICLADMPLIQAHSYQGLIKHFNADPNLICRPYNTEYIHEQPGHPVIFPCSLKPLLLTLDGDKGAQGLISQHPINLVSVCDKGIYLDIDTQQDLQKI